MQLRPLADKVIVKPLVAQEMTATGILLPQTAEKDRPEQGEIIAVGPGKFENGTLVAPRVKAGDKVVFKKYAPDEVTVDGKEYFVLSESDLMAVIE